MLITPIMNTNNHKINQFSFNGNKKQIAKLDNKDMFIKNDTNLNSLEKAVDIYMDNYINIYKNGLNQELLNLKIKNFEKISEETNKINIHSQNFASQKDRFIGLMSTVAHCEFVTRKYSSDKVIKNIYECCQYDKDLLKDVLVNTDMSNTSNMLDNWELGKDYAITLQHIYSNKDEDLLDILIASNKRFHPIVLNYLWESIDVINTNPDKVVDFFSQDEKHHQDALFFKLYGNDLKAFRKQNEKD